MTITLDWWQWVLPAIIASAIVGLNKGWRIMGLWTVGVFFSGLVAARIGPKLDVLLTKLLSVGGQFFAIATDKTETSISTPQIHDRIPVGAGGDRFAIPCTRVPVVVGRQAAGRRG